MKNFIVGCGLIAAIVSFVYWVGFSDDAKRAEAAQAAQERADATPHVIREADGCKVYAFKAGDNWHYFTRCGSTVTTEHNWTESHQQGKRIVTERKAETIVTEGNR